MTPEDIGDIFQALEDALFAMAIRNMDTHKNWEKDEGFKWTQWQAEQIKGLREYREKVNIMTNKGFDEAKKAVEEFLQEAYEDSVDDAAGLAVEAGKGYIRPGFFGVNSDKMNIILDEAVKDIDTKRYACINRMNSGYTDFLRKADIFAQSGSMTIPQALDYAMKDFLSAGLNCVEYSNGNRVNIASYAEMALRTSSSEVTRQANGDVRNVLNEYLVVSNVIGMTCPYCQKWQGKVMIDDVYSDGKPDGEHRLVSEAKADHFLHPNCRHQLFMYIEGITEIADLPNDVETKEHYKAEQEQRRQEREIRKYKRLRDGAVDPADRQKYDARVKEWTAKHNKFLSEHDYLRKNPKRLAPGYTGNGKPEVGLEEAGRLKHIQKRIESEKLLHETLRNQSVVIGSPNVDLDYIKSHDFSSKFSRLTDDSSVNDKLRKFAQSSLTANNGSYTESLLVINANDGEDIIRRRGKTDALGVQLTLEEADMIRDIRSVKIGIHNHPTNILPTGSDFIAAAYRRYDFGLVVTHEGRVFRYTPPTMFVSAKEIDRIIDKAVEGTYTDSDAMSRYFGAMDELKRFGITWEEM